MNLLSIWGDALIVCAVGIGIVLTVLLLLVFILNGFSAIVANKIGFPKKSNKKVFATDEDFQKVHLSTCDSAAIATALYLLYQNDSEDNHQTITIKKIERRYSPWSSKIYGINNLVR